jgi:outer membrane protein TolC
MAAQFFKGKTMKLLSLSVVFLAGIAGSAPRLHSEPLPLKRAVELALAHSTAGAISSADEQHAFASYLSARNAYVPQLVVGSGLGQTWGYPLSLEGSAPSIVNMTAQSALINPSLREFVRAARKEWQASSMQSKDQRQQVMQDTILSYMELSKWEALMPRLQQEQDEARKGEQVAEQRIQEGVDNAQTRTRARLTTARVRFRMAQARASRDVLKEHLAHLTGLVSSTIETSPESIPALPELKQDDDLAGQAVNASPAVEAAQNRAAGLDFRARGEHRALWPSIDFASQYALLATFNHYQDFFRVGSFQRHNATIGVVIRFPFLNPSQHAVAQGADADAVRAHKQLESAKNQVSEETLKLQRSVEQLAAAQQVADLEYQVAQANVDATQVRLDAGTANLHDAEAAHNELNERFNALQDTGFELERARVGLLRATGQMETWVGVPVSK